MDMSSRSLSLSNNDPELYHFALGAHWEKKNHKYIKKIPMGKGFKYIYDLSELKRGNNNQKTSAITTTKQNIYKNVTSVSDSIMNKIGERTIKETKNESALLALAVGALAAPTALKLMKRGLASLREHSVNEYVKGQKNTREKVSNIEESQFKKIEKQSTMQEDQKNINPNYPNPGYTENCFSCTLAYDLRRRGYDVEAISTKNGMTTDKMLECYSEEVYDTYKNKAVSNPKKNAKEFEDALSNLPDGSRGVFNTRWIYGNGHSMIWEKVNGKIIIRDCQSNKTYDAEYILKRSSSFEYWRTDNIKVNKNIVSAVKNRGA